MTPLRRYYRGHSLVAMRDVQANQTRYYHADHQGTTQALTDSTGAVTDRFASDAWGVQVKRTGSSINRQWYVGQLGYYRQVDQALDYVRARYYGDARGRWVSRDPVAFGGAVWDPRRAGRGSTAYFWERLASRWNAYAYANGSPSVYDDPSGKVPSSPPPPPPSGSCDNWQCLLAFTMTAKGSNSGTLTLEKIDTVTGAHVTVALFQVFSGLHHCGPEADCIPNKGPIPRGSYTAGQCEDECDSTTISGPCMKLYPNMVKCNGTSRGGFAIHVDQHSNQSQGCIVLETTADFQQLVKVLRANCVFPVRVQADYSVKRAKKCGG
jgi:RHS repeat-associated protein